MTSQVEALTRAKVYAQAEMDKIADRLVELSIFQAAFPNDLPPVFERERARLSTAEESWRQGREWAIDRLKTISA